MSETYAVVLADPLIEDTDTIQKITDALKTVTGMLPYDATRLAKNAQGVLIEGITSLQAGRIVSELSARGIQAGAADAIGLPENPTIRPVREIAVSEAALSVQLGYTAMDTIPWDRIDLLSVCLHWQPKQKIALTKDHSNKRLFRAGMAMMAGNLVGALRQARLAAREGAASVQRSQQGPSEGEHYVVDLHLSGPSETLRLKSNACAYSYLGNRMQQSANDNMKIVVADIASASEVVFSPMAMQLLHGDPLTDCRIDNLHMFERYNRWVFLGMKAFGDAEGETAPPR